MINPLSDNSYITPAPVLPSSNLSNGCGCFVESENIDLSGYVRNSGSPQTISSILNYTVSPTIPDAVNANQPTSLGQVQALIPSVSNYIQNQYDDLQDADFRIAGTGAASMFFAGDPESDSYAYLSQTGINWSIDEGQAHIYLEDSAFNISSSKDIILNGATLQAFNAPTVPNSLIRLVDLPTYVIQNQNSAVQTASYLISGQGIARSGFLAGDPSSGSFAQVSPSSYTLIQGSNTLSILQNGLNISLGGNVSGLNSSSTQTILSSNKDIIITGTSASVVTDLKVNGITVGRGGNTSSTSENVAIGNQALLFASNISGSSNLAVGEQSLKALTTGIENVALGSYALTRATTDNFSVAIGYAALAFQNFSGTGNSGNTAVGYFSGERTTTGDRNTFLGGVTGFTNLTGSDNVYVGYHSGYLGIGGQNTYLGSFTGVNNIGTGNVFLGYGAGETTTNTSYKFILGSGILNTYYTLLTGDFLTGQLNLPTIPTTSASTYSTLTRNTTTGAIESVLPIGYTAPNTSTPFTRKLIAYGSSLTIGVGVADITSYTQTYVYKAATTSGFIPINYGLGGRSTQQLTAGDNSLFTIMNNLITPLSSDDILIIEGMVNDIVKTGYDSAIYTTQLTTIVNTAITKGWAANHIILYNPSQYGTTFYGQSDPTGRHLIYAAATQSIATSLGTLFYDTWTDLLNANNANPIYLYSDGLHMTAAGQLLAGSLLSTFINLHFPNAVDYSVTQSSVVGNQIVTGTLNVLGDLILDGGILLPAYSYNGVDFTNNGVLHVSPNGRMTSTLLQSSDFSPSITLPNGIRATTQATTDATTLIATDAYVQNNVTALKTFDAATYLTLTSAGSTYVPYTGASSNLNLGIHNFQNTGTLTTTAITGSTAHFSLSGVTSDSTVPFVFSAVPTASSNYLSSNPVFVIAGGFGLPSRSANLVIRGYNPGAIGGGIVFDWAAGVMPGAVISHQGNLDLGITTNVTTFGNGNPFTFGVNGNFGIGTLNATSNLLVNQSTVGVGTISTVAAGTTVTGTGTIFLNTFAVGQTITANGETRTISAIASNTSMTTNAWTNTNTTIAYTLVGGTRFSVAGNGNVNIPILTASESIQTDTSKNLISIANTGTGNNVLAISPTLTGTPLAPTPTFGANTTQIATMAALQAAAVPIIGTPTIVAGPGAGTSPTVTVTTNGKMLHVTIGTGLIPSTSAIIATITLATALSYTPMPVISLGNSSAGFTAPLTDIAATSSGPSNITLLGSNTALAATTTYVLNIAI